jgi:RNA polymerase sigma-70 factor (ECF subfamily)
MTQDSSLIAAMKAGDSRALDQFYRTHAKTVLAWVLRLGGPSMDAEDAAQEVFVIALRRVHTFRGEARLTTWLFSITRNVVSNRRRKSAIRRFVGLERAEKVSDGSPGTDERIDSHRQRRLVQLALERLPQNQREVIILMDLEERSAPEVGEMLGVPAGTVYSRLHYARKSFAKALQRQDGGTTWRMVTEKAGGTS